MAWRGKAVKGNGPGRVSPGYANPPVPQSGQPDTRTTDHTGPPRSAQAGRHAFSELYLGSQTVWIAT